MKALFIFTILILIILLSFLIFGCGESPLSNKQESDKCIVEEKYITVIITDLNNTTAIYKATDLNYIGNSLQINLLEGCGIEIPEFNENIKYFKVY